MTKGHRQTINDFFVNVFNKILLYEEQAMGKAGCRDLSMREIHVLEAVEGLEREKKNSMSRIAGRLSISVGSLTTSMNVLVRKGYVERESSMKDRRIVYACLTPKGRLAAKKHSRFHRQMVESLEQSLNEEEWDALTRALRTLETFFCTSGEKGAEKKNL
ncbi:MAG: winged helix-turn-helix transcriptional regulator [Lachnospiraceae bacterium]|jgi:DNA-binding MarR family transcriptional regulator|nr:winged helix-turn-helix transcriptional regulator [Lachnospiraceae bacterium]